MAGMAHTVCDVSESNAELDEHSQASSEVTETESCDIEVESPIVHPTGTAISKATKSRVKSQKVNSSVAARRNNASRSRKKVEESPDRTTLV